MTAPVVSQIDVERLAGVLARARSEGKGLATPPIELSPADEGEAYAVQHATLRALATTPAGWKVGAKSPDGPIQGAPLPATTIYRRTAALERQAFVKPGLELEIAFTLGRPFAAHGGPYSDAEVLAAIDTMHAAIEIVASRFEQWPDIDKRWQLADLQNHGALIIGEGVPYAPDYSFVSPRMRFAFAHTDLVAHAPANPAGDPRRLLPWIVNHSTARGLDLKPGIVLTCGSYTGMYFPTASGTARGEIEGLAPVEATLA